MSKRFRNLFIGVSVLPALLVMPVSGLELDLYGEQDIEAGVYENASRRYIWVNPDATVNIQANAVFNNNRAEGTSGSNGGAIVNEGVLNILGQPDNMVEFNSNYSSEAAGAIENDSILCVNNTSFSGNHAEDYAGAITNASVANVWTSVFTGNYATGQAGAILNFLYDKKNGQTVDDVVLDVRKTSFYENHANTSGGAISTFSVANINNSSFVDNYTESDEFGNGGGAMFVGAESLTKITDSLFENNTSASAGGAIMTRSADIANNVAAKLDITGTTFRGNTAATTGGALDTYFYNSVAKEYQMYVANSTFENNTAAQGGAIFNHGMVDKGGNQAAIYLGDVSFTGNIASENGGAIYNESAMELFGANTFTGNRAAGKSNDIYNIGALNISGGTTVIDGGINGADGVLTIADGATLNINTASIVQDTITLNGNMLATLRDGDAQIIANTFNGSGTLTLTMKDAGTYKVFGNAAFDNIAWDSNAITATSPIYNLTWDGGDVTATRKTTEEIATDNELSNETAAMVSNLMDSSSGKLNDLAEIMQEKLATGTDQDKAAVESAASAVNPEKESVVQSVATSVQTTITHLASSRMASPMIGRGGGDIKLTSGGVWAHGIFNKSKQDDAFSGYTRGIAAGLDGMFNRIWTLGAGYSYAHSDVSGTARNTEIDSSTVFIYGQYKPKQWYVNAIANYTMSDYSETAHALGTPVFADYGVDSFGGVIASGYDFASGVTPELGLRYMHVVADDYTNSLGVKLHTKNNDFVTAVFGTKYSFNVKADKYTSFVPQLNAAVKYDLLSDDNIATVTMPGIDSYTLDGKRLSRIGGEFGIGLGMKHRNIDFSVNYDIDVRENYTSQTGMVKFRCNF